MRRWRGGAGQGQERQQPFVDVVGFCGPVLGGLGQQVEDQILDLWGHVGAERTQGWWRLDDVLAPQFEVAAAGEDPSPGEEFVQDAAEDVQVALRTSSEAIGLGRRVLDAMH
ncbi:hypothetical protein [Micromonospora sonchi]|uniref:hypothetical protein n=1 Tax=Micromonospora sonchi TaxID=1763543 RepID=UPI001663BF66|nr:hypothetical protein [Micromonospora sonchi]